jgi:hypothetical protein
VNQYVAARTIIAILVLPALVISALWFPFGFSLGGLIEEWDILFLFARHGLFFIADHSSPLALHQARPLTILPQAVAYLLDPNSFFYWHIIQAASLLLKGFSAGAIGFYLTGSRAHAAVLGLLTILYPADTMQLSFRSIHINWAIASALLASALLIWAVHIGSRYFRIAVAVIAAGLFTFALLMYEVVIGLAALPFLILFARLGRNIYMAIRRSIDAIVIWACMIATWFVFFVFAIRAGSGYQAAALATVDFDSILSRLTFLASSGLYRAFYECWAELVGPILASLSDYTYMVSILLLIFLVLLWLAGDDSKPPRSKIISIRIAVVGLITFLLGYAPYLSDQSHLLLTQRVFLVPAIGAALVLLGCILLIARILPRFLVTAPSVLLIGGCFVSQLYQFDEYNRIYATVTRPILSAVAPFISESATHRYSILINDYGFLSGTWDLGLELQLALGYLIPNVQVDHIFVCEASSGRLLPRANGPIAHRGFCRQTEHGLMIAEPEDAAVELKDAAIGKLGPDGTMSLDRSSQMITERLPDRALRLFSFGRWEPTDSMFRAQERPDHFECRFESMWGYAVPCRTFGFYDALPDQKDLSSSYAWIGETRSGLIFDIEPHDQIYQLLIKMLKCVSPSRQLKITLNGTRLIETSDDPGHIQATFSGKLLRERNNVLEFDTELENTLGLSFAVKTVSVKPIQE